MSQKMTCNEVGRFTLHLEINVPINYDLLKSVHSWIYPDVQPVPEVTGPDYFGRLFRIKGKEFPLIIRQNAPGQRLEISTPVEDVAEKEVRLLLERILGLRKIMDSALSKMKRDPKLRQIAGSVKGIRPYVAESFYEALVKSIIQQQISYRSANVVTKRLILGLSNKSVFQGLDLYGFPSPVKIANYGVDGLGKFGIGYRTKYVHSLSSLVASRDIDLESLEDKSFSENLQVLGSIHGIGEWTIKAALIAGFGDLTVFPYGDLGIQNVMGALYNKGVRMTKAQVIEKSDEWGKEGPSILYLLMSAYVLELI